MAKNKQRIDWRGLAKRLINDDDLRFPDVQPDHPAMKAFRGMIYWNMLSPEERSAIEGYFASTGQKPLPEKDILKMARGGKIDRDELIEMLFTGLMDDTGYGLYLEERERCPDINALDYFERTSYNEKDPKVRKVAEIFKALLDEPEPEPKEYVPHISRNEFEKMRHDLDWVQKNLKSLEKSKKVWPKKLGRGSSK